MSRNEPHLFEAVKRLGSSVLGTLQTRLELAGLELGEAGSRLVMTIVTSVAALLLAGGAVALLTAWVAVALWATLGHAVLGWLALAYGVAGAAMLWWQRTRLRGGPALLADTLAALRADAAAFRSEVAAREPDNKR